MGEKFAMQKEARLVDEERPDEVPFPLVGLAQGGALGLRVLHQALDEVR